MEKSTEEKPNSIEPFERTQNSSLLRSECCLSWRCGALRSCRFPAPCIAQAPWRKDCGSAAPGGSLQNGLHAAKQRNHCGKTVPSAAGCHNHDSLALLQIRQCGGRHA